MSNHKVALAFSTLVGTIVGAGIFALPYVVVQAGLAVSLVYFIVLGGAVLLLHLMFGEVALRTEGSHRLVGYAGLYLGSWARALAAFSTLVGVLGALLAYIIIGGEFLETIAAPLFSIKSSVASLLLWAALSFFIVQGIQLITKLELVMNVVLFAVVGVIFATAAPHIEPAHFTAGSLSNLFLPFGIILFALTGWSAIPELADYFKGRRERRSFQSVITAASVVTVLLSVAFAVVVVGVSGPATSQDALSGLMPQLGKQVVILGALLGVLAIAASFLVLGNYLKNTLRHDFHLPYWVAASVVVAVPGILFLIGVREFIPVIGTVGAVVGGVEGVLITFIFLSAAKKGRRRPEYALTLPRPLVGLAAVLMGLGALLSIVL